MNQQFINNDKKNTLSMFMLYQVHMHVTFGYCYLYTLVYIV